MKQQQQKKLGKMVAKKKVEEEVEDDDDDVDEYDEKDEGDDDEDDDDEDDEDDDDDDDDEDDDDDDGNESKQQQKGFTDENASWLKLKSKSNKKQQLFDDDDDENEEEEDDDDDEQDDNDEDQDDDEDEEDGDDDDDDELDIERESRLLNQEKDLIADEADIEYRKTIKDHTAIYHLPTPAELDDMIHTTDRVVPPSELHQHIESIIEVLADFNVRRESMKRSRQEYIHVLTVFVAELYGYIPELIEYFMTMFPPNECIEFIKASDQPRPLVIRTNTIKTRRKDLAAALIKRGVTLDPLASWSKVGIKIIDSTVPIGATPEYLAGHYMLQSASSLCPVLALNPQPNELVLDMSSAPGGKTSYIAQLMRNTGTIIANDLQPNRQKATIANLHRLGIKNTIVCSYDGRHIPTKVFVNGNRFDRILLDAPCSGLGIISRDPSIKVQRTIADIKQCAHLQKELLLAAIDALKYKSKTGGGNSSDKDGQDTSNCCMVYSTCSISVYENEDVVQYALEKRDIQIIDSGLSFGTDGYTKYNHKRYHPSMKLCKRFYPHTYNMDGFFVCKIKKLSNHQKKKETIDENNNDKEMESDVIQAEEEVETRQDNNANKRRIDNNSNNKVNSKKKKGQEVSKAAGSISTSATNTMKKNASSRKNAKVTKPRRLKKVEEQM